MTGISFDREKHWDHVYQSRSVDRLSWYQTYPSESMRFIEDYGSGTEAHVLDVGGGSGNLVDVLLAHNYHHVDVLDISEVALEIAEKRLGRNAETVTWIHTDVLNFNPGTPYDIWHDRATFHFLTDPDEIHQYISLASQTIREGGLLVLATFSDKGPRTCSNLPVHKYSQSALEELLKAYFIKIECINADHYTPRETVQNFTYCAFRRNTFNKS